MTRTKEQILAYKREWARKWRAANPDKVREQNKKHVDKYPEKTRERQRAYAEKNKEKRKAAWDKWYAANRENQIAKTSAYAKEHKKERSAAVKRRMSAVGTDGLTGYQRQYRENRDQLLAAAKEGYKNGGKERAIAWAKANPEKVKAAAEAYLLKNIEKVRAAQAQRYAKFPVEKRHAWQTEYRKKNTAKIRAFDSKRRASKLNATVSWGNEFYIEEIYDLAQRRTKLLGIKHTVDHIVPLKSKLVCGLHNEFNLQVISHSANSKKGNRYWPNMPERRV